MKYTVLINQLKCQEIEPEMTFQDAIVLDCIQGLCSSVSEAIQHNRKEKDGKQYTWVSYKHVLAELPMLKGNTSSAVGIIIKRLETYKLLDTFMVKNTRRKYFRLTSKAELLFRNTDSLIGNPNSKNTNLFGKPNSTCLENQTNPITNKQVTNSKVTASGKSSNAVQEEGAGKYVSSRIKMDGIAEDKPKRKIRRLDEQYLPVLEAFKQFGAYKNCTDKTKSVYEGIPRAIKLFNQQFGEREGQAKLIESLQELFASDLYQWIVDNQPLGTTPKAIFSQKFIEDKLIPFVTKLNYDKKSRGMVQRPKTEEERRKIQEANQKRIEEHLGRNARKG